LLHCNSIVTSGDKVIVAAGGNVIYSRDFGQTWSNAYPVTGMGEVHSLCISGSNILAGTLSSSVWSKPLSQFWKQAIVFNEPNSFSLNQNYPNPFYDMTNINYTLSEESMVNLSVYDIYGTKIAELENGSKSAGNYNVIFDGNLLSSGTYFYRLEVNGKLLTGSMKIVK
jgi:hypothetical protein